MILRDRLQILDELLNSAKDVLTQYKEIAKVASESLIRAKAYMNLETTSPSDVLDTFRRIHDMQIQSLQTFNSIIERFPVEHSIQELQLLEIFRNLSEAQKQSFMSTLEQIIKQRGRR